MGNLCSKADRWASQNPVESTSPIPGSILIGNPLAIAIGKTVCMHRRNGLETMCDRGMESNFFLSSAAEASPSLEISQSSSEWPGRGRHFRWRSDRAACLVMYTSLCPPCSSLMLHVLMSVKSKSQAKIPTVRTASHRIASRTRHLPRSRYDPGGIRVSLWQAEIFCGHKSATQQQR